MFKDVFIIRKKAYHVKMMKYIWGLGTENFSHICPYFWLTVFNHIIFLPYFIFCKFFVLLGYVFGKLGTALMGSWEKNLAKYNAWQDKLQRRAAAREAIREERREEKRRRAQAKRYEEWQKQWQYYQEHPEELAKKKIEGKDVEERSSFFQMLREESWEAYRSFGDKVNDIYWKLEREKEEKIENERLAKEERERQAAIQKKKQLFIRKYDGEDKQELLLGDGWENGWAVWETKKKQSDIEREAARIRANKERINKTLRIVKPISTVFLWAIGAVVVVYLSYYGFKATKWCYEGFASVKHHTWQGVGIVFKWIGIIILGAGSIVGVLYLFIVNPLKIHIHIRAPKFLRRKRKYQAAPPVKKYKPYKEPWIIKLGNALATGIGYIGLFFEWTYKNLIRRPWRAVKGAGYFMVQMIKSNCPAVQWQDDETKIN